MSKVRHKSIGLSERDHITQIKPSKKTGSTSLGVAGLVLIGTGGIIGAGFFLGAGLPIRTAGPAVLFAYLIGALVMAQVTGALTSLAVNDPQPGAFMTYANKYIGVYAGFLQGWSYYIASILTVASESVAMSIFSHLWIPYVPLWILTSVYALMVIVINGFGTNNFGRVESIMSTVKIGAMAGFIVFVGLSILPHSSSLSLRTPTHAIHPFSHGLFTNGTTGLFQSMLVVIFAYAGIGVFATATSQMQRPQDTHKAAWITVITLATLYMVSILLLLFVTPWQQMSTTKSPFVTVLQQSGIPLLGDAFNIIILVASFSVMAGAVFSANQILQSLSQVHQAPKFALLRNRRGTTIGSLSCTTVGVALTILISYSLPANVYNFLISASSFITFLNWFLILWAFLAWRHHSHDVQTKFSSLAFGQPASSVITMFFILLMTGYALLQRDQRIGFYAFAALCCFISLIYLSIRTFKKHVHKRMIHP